MGFKYTRVRDKNTGHEYDVLSHKVDPDKHEPVDTDRWPESNQIRPPRHNVKGPRPTTDTDTDTEVEASEGEVEILDVDDASTADTGAEAPTADAVDPEATETPQKATAQRRAPRKAAASD